MAPTFSGIKSVPNLSNISCNCWFTLIIWASSWAVVAWVLPENSESLYNSVNLTVEPEEVGRTIDWPDLNLLNLVISVNSVTIVLLSFI